MRISIMNEKDSFCKSYILVMFGDDKLQNKILEVVRAYCFSDSEFKNYKVETWSQDEKPSMKQLSRTTKQKIGDSNE